MQVGEGIAKAGRSSGSPPPGPEEDEDTFAASLRFVEIRGLYRPGFDDGTRRDDGSGYGCGYQVGYTSSDDRGRIFVNHRPRANASEPWEDARARDVQYIEMIVQIQTTGTIPSTVQIEWSWEDPDDPSDASMHTAAARHIDPNGTRGNDNRGACDFGPARGSRRPAFQAVRGFAMTGGGSTCRTAISGNESRVRLHLTNVGGDNFRVTARVAGVHGETVVRTGIMTMWKRIDVEYHQMQQVWVVPVDQVVRAFEPACVQLDFTRPIDEPHQTALTGGEDFETFSAAYAQRVFRNAGRPGWFLLVAADYETSLSLSSPRSTAYAGPGTIIIHDGRQWIAIPTVLATPPATVRLRNGSNTLTFMADGTATDPQNPGWTFVRLEPLAYYNVPDPRDGSTTYAYGLPNHYLPLRQPGYQNLGFSDTVDCEVTTGLRRGAYGITPPVSRGSRDHFAGRSIVFMGRFDSADESVQTIVHELCHGFGAPHACGRPAADASSGHACAMAILDHWMFRPGTGNLQRWHSPARHTEFCEYHLRGLRETHLEDNPALWQWNS